MLVLRIASREIIHPTTARTRFVVAVSAVLDGLASMEAPLSVARAAQPVPLRSLQHAGNHRGDTCALLALMAL